LRRCKALACSVHGLGCLAPVAVDVTGEPMPCWAVGVDPQALDAIERAPPTDWYGVDPPAPES